MACAVKAITYSNVFVFAKYCFTLQRLEQGHLFQLYSPEHDNDTQVIKVFLITAFCNKPAQCLIQCLPEPTAYFDCRYCEVKGKLIRSFLCPSKLVFVSTSLFFSVVFLFCSLFFLFLIEELTSIIIDAIYVQKSVS